MDHGVMRQVRCGRRAFRAGVGRAFLWLFSVSIAASGLAPQARGSVIPYPLALFQVVNTNADGAALSLDGGLSVVLTGGNNGSGLEGTTDLQTRAISSGTIEFQYIYNSPDAPAFDSAGYVIDGQYTQLADTDGDFGTASFLVAPGNIFGFRVYTFDNTQEAGVFSVSTFATDAATAPEPATPILIAFSFLTAALLYRHKNRSQLKDQL